MRQRRSDQATPQDAAPPRARWLGAVARLPTAGAAAAGCHAPNSLFSIGLDRGAEPACLIRQDRQFLHAIRRNLGHDHQPGHRHVAMRVICCREESRVTELLPRTWNSLLICGRSPGPVVLRAQYRAHRPGFSVVCPTACPKTILCRRPDCLAWLAPCRPGRMRQRAAPPAGQPPCWQGSVCEPACRDAPASVLTA